ncbi:MAG: type IX secretion system sortase PorU [Chitinophagaceae bacterium]
MTRGYIYCFALVALTVLKALSLDAQRVYTAHSVLSTGNWYKISVKEAGIYKIDLPFLSSLGINTSSLNSATVRVFGNGGEMLPEKAGAAKTDDLAENAIWVEDGGDGVLNGNDYILFYARGPHEWLKDSVNKTFAHRKNLYSEQSYYYITVGGNNKRIETAANPGFSNITITDFNERYFYELDTFNLLSSGRSWVGEEFSDGPGKLLTRNFSIPVPAATGQPCIININCVARSFNTASRFTVRANNQQVTTFFVSPVGTGPYDLFAASQKNSVSMVPAAETLSLGIDYTTGSSGSQGWLDWLEVLPRRNLSLTNVNQLLFRDWNSVGGANTGHFVIRNAASATEVWDVTNALQPVRMQGSLAGTEYSFNASCNSLHEYVAFNNTGFLSPTAVGRVNNQDLHNNTLTDFLVVAHASLLTQANRLAQYHQQKDNLRTLVVTADQVFNEFSSGIPDPTAVRDFVKMYFDKAGGDSSLRPRYLLLFGAGSFDYKNRLTNNTNFVPAYESPESLDPLSTYTSDDFFGFLDDADDINGSGTYLLDIGIGRIPATSDAEAKAMVDKIVDYNSAAAFGPWRNEYTFVADDEDNNLHLQDAETVTAIAAATDTLLNLDKIYLDAYKQQSNSSGARYPDVNLAISNKMFSGTLVWNYAGHGSYRRLAEEVVLDQDIINTFNNAGKLPLFITATCDVAPYDNPLVSSIGENLLLRPKTGAIALMTTTRLVFAYSNRIMNSNYTAVSLARKTDGTYRSLGEAVKLAKNTTYTFSGDVNNNRKFTLLGDPALTLAFPQYQVKTTAVNGIPVTAATDTLKALSEYTISGRVEDRAGNILTNFNGTVYPVIFDKMQTVTTLANDPGSFKTTFQVQKSMLFKGKAQVINGLFTFNFVVPKDINYQYGNGKISYYASGETTDANGATTIIVGGSGSGVSDKDGPDIKAYLNDEKFVSGSITNDKPVLLLKLADSSGINIMGTGIGHDLVAILDNDQQNPYVLNNFYEADINNYRKGVVRFQLPQVAEGLHTLQIKAWDAVNNSSEKALEFRVIKEADFAIDHVLNYPNPFTTQTTFWFEHNRPGEQLNVSIRIYSVAGRLVKTIRSTIFSPGNRSSEVQWDGKDDYGSKIGRGVYIYRLRVQTADGKTAEKLEKLFIL